MKTTKFNPYQYTQRKLQLQCDYMKSIHQKKNQKTAEYSNDEQLAKVWFINFLGMNN